MKKQWFLVAMVAMMSVTAWAGGEESLYARVGSYEQTVVAGSKNVKLLSLFVDNHSNNWQYLTSITLVIFTSGDSPSTLFDFRLKNEWGDFLPLTNDPNVDVSQAWDRQWAIVPFQCDPNYLPYIAPNSAAELQVVFDTTWSIKEGTVVLGLVWPGWIESQNAIHVYPDSLLISPATKIMESGEIGVTTTLYTRDSYLVLANTVGFCALAIDISARWEDVKIDALPIYFGKVNGGGPDQVRKISVSYWDTDMQQIVQAGDAFPTTTDQTPKDPVPLGNDNALMWLRSPIVVRANQTITVWVQVDTASCENWQGTMGESGQGFNLIVPSQEIVARGLGSGREITATPALIQSNYFYLFRSFPRVITNERFNSGDRIENGILLPREEQKNLYRLEIRSAGNDVAIGRLAYYVQQQNVISQNFRLYQAGRVVGEGTVGDDGILVIEPANPIYVPESQGWPGVTLTLAADTTVTGPDARLLVTLLNDEQRPAIMPTNFAGLSNYFFGWTDLTWSGPQGPDDPEVRNRLQWSNGYLITGLYWGELIPPVSTPVVFAR